MYMSIPIIVFTSHVSVGFWHSWRNFRDTEYKISAQYLHVHTNKATKTQGHGV